MENIINSIAIILPTIIIPVIASIISFVLIIFLTPLHKWVSSETKEYCSFSLHLTLQDRKEHKQPARDEITVTKRLGKTKNINCPHFKSEDTKIEKHKGKKYLYCRFGKPFNPKNNKNRKCPFY